jgi:glycosyltransferase involved in cell wall biosynthesis
VGKKVRISIALATYNGAKYLPEQLDSFLVQTKFPDELVVCDDNSGDDTIALLKSFSKSAPFEVRIIRNTTNLGYTQNFAKAISHCSGDVIFLSDQDDVWFDNKIERVTSLFEKSPNCWVVVHNARIVDEHLSWSDVTKLQQIRLGYGSRGSLVTGALTALRRNYIPIIIPIPPGIVGHDHWIHGLCSIFEGRRIVCEECLQLIRRHFENTSEWVVNSRKRIGKLDVFLSQFQTTPAVDYSDRIIINEAMQDRLTEITKILNRPSDIAAAIGEGDRLKKEHYALERRQRLALSGLLARRYLAFSMLLRGDYEYFNGLRSFMRDIFRK